MASLKGMSVILAPTLQEEAEIPAGNARLKTVNPATCAASSSPLPCPGGTPAPTPPILNSGFLPACAARCFARIPCKGTLTEALSGEALRQGAVELS